MKSGVGDKVNGGRVGEVHDVLLQFIVKRVVGLNCGAEGTVGGVVSE